jgi:hypothetical protein
LVVTLPGGTSHTLMHNALARTLRARGWRTSIVLPDFDLKSLQSKGLLDEDFESVVFRTPPRSNERFQVGPCLRVVLGQCSVEAHGV